MPSIINVAYVKEMAEATASVGALSREECRQAAAERFPADGMTARYLRLYDELIQAHASSPSNSSVSLPDQETAQRAR